MAYFKKYYLEFTDEHTSMPAQWRIDIYDSEGEVPTEPFLLEGTANVLVTEILNERDDKNSFVIGRQITIGYKYDGNINTPLPSEFFESAEKRFKVEVSRNGALDGVYYVKPDYSQYPDDPNPIDIYIKAIDGFGFAAGTRFDMFDGGLLKYDKIDLYEAIMTRAIDLIMDYSPTINVLSTLLPVNISPGDKLLFGVFVHTDAFYDFVKGAKFVSEVLETFCRAFYCRMYSAGGKIWMVRTQDLTGSVFSVDSYTAPAQVDTVTDIDFVLSGGPDPSAYDVMPIDEIPLITGVPAIKLAPFDLLYKSINQLQNFDWSQWDGVNFASWNRFEQEDHPLIINQVGEGTEIDPFRLYIQHYLPLASQGLQQSTVPGSVRAGDIVEIEFRYRFTNTDNFYIRVRVGDSSELYLTLNEGGMWEYTFGTSPGRFLINRSGNKRSGSLTIKSIPIPQNVVDNNPFPTNSTLQFFIGIPQSQNTMDDPLLPGSVEIWPVKVGIISMSDQGRHVEAENLLPFTQVLDTEDAFFITTGEDGISNTLFVDGGVPATQWDNDKPSVSPQDIERHMATSYIDQHRRSLTMWEGSLYSNNLYFYQVIEFIHISGKRFMQLSDTYDNVKCTHNVKLVEVFEEGSGQADYLEYDIKEKDSD